MRVQGYYVLIPCVFVAASTTPLYAQRVIYVSENAGDIGDGTSWADAYTDLQDALDDARNAGDLDAEIWVAAGTYKPDRGTGDPTLAFELFGGIALYGGFGGWEESRDERDPNVNITSLSGDLDGDDDPHRQPLSDCCVIGNPGTCSDADECHAAVVAARPDCADRWRQICTGIAIALCCELCRPSRCDNTYNVVRVTDPESTAPRLDGLSIVDGEALDPDGNYRTAGGLYSFFSNPVITRCTFARNTGGALYARGSTPTVEDSVFMDNGTEVAGGLTVEIDDLAGPITLKALLVLDNSGPGVWVSDTAVTFVDSIFSGNSGGGLYCLSSDCTLVRSQVVGNDSYGMYGDLFGQTRIVDSLFQRNSRNGLFTSGPAFIVNSVFAGNTTGGLGAGVRAGFGGVYVLNSVFFGNSADSIGGMAVGDGGATIRNSIFWGNSDDSGFTQHAQFAGNSMTFVDVDYSIVHGWTGSWGGIGNSGIDPMFVDADGVDDFAGTGDDDLRLLPGSPAINAGDPNEIYLPLADLDGHARVLCDRVDLGAYEFGIGDYNCDQSVDLSDFSTWQSCMTGPGATSIPAGCEAFDFNVDSTIDLRDFAGLVVALSAE